MYEEYRAYAFAIAYRMLGTVSDAEDAVHDLFTELAGWDGAHVRHWKGYLAKWVTNRCLNALRSARRQRELYTGEWLPEPWMSAELDPGEELVRKDTLGYAYMVLLERLAPAERAVFVLREAFGYGYDEIGAMLDKSEANCRKICSRAKQRLQEADSADSAEARRAAVSGGSARVGHGDDGGGAGARAMRSEADGGAGARAMRSEADGGAGARAMRSEADGGAGARAMRSEAGGGAGARAMRSEAGGGAGARAVRSEAGGGAGARAGLAADRAAVVGRFIAAFRSCDAAAMLAVLTEDARLVTDGGDRVRSAIRPILGADRVTALLTSPRAFVSPRQWTSAPVQLNGALGLVFALNGEVKAALAFRFAAEGDKLERLYWVLNPEKLTHLQPPPAPAR
uniref:RNA polymerase sigma-70 factor, ECF subfamily n=1 Tax=Paenibacillus athensensis TaxID=1967502 RepID=A0A4Y8Q914_9BACL